MAQRADLRRGGAIRLRSTLAHGRRREPPAVLKIVRGTHARRKTWNQFPHPTKLLFWLLASSPPKPGGSHLAFRT